MGAPQAFHFQQLFDAARRWGLPGRLQHVAFGSILGADGTMMKTRSGESVGLLEVLEEAEERALNDDENEYGWNDEPRHPQAA